MQPAIQPPKPYKFQDRAIRIVDKKFDSGFKSLVLVSPTGSGKTVMAAHIMNRECFPVVRCISHRVSLNEQNKRLLCPTFTPQSLFHGIPEGFGKPDLVIWEECHRSEAPVFKTVRDKFPKATLLGLTATPQRADGLGLGLFEEMVVAAHYSELLLNRTIVPCEVVIPEAFFEDQAPDIADAYLDNREPGSRAMLFCKSTEEADLVAERLRKAAPYHCHKSAKHNREALEAFRTGKLDVLTTVDALSEGIDVPEANLLILGTKCESAMTYLQRCGRILRSADGKRRARLVDCVGASLRHGSPTEDRIYSIDGTGIQRRGGSGMTWDYEREAPERGEVKPYKAKWKVLYGWSNATEDDKRRQLGWLRQHAARNGYTEEVAQQCFHALFGDTEPEAAPSGRRKSTPPPASQRRAS